MIYYYDDLWDVINLYVRHCGGDPKTKNRSAKQLIPSVEQLFRIACREAFEDGVMAALQKIPRDADCYEQVGSAIDRIDNPYQRRDDLERHNEK